MNTAKLAGTVLSLGLTALSQDTKPQLSLTQNPVYHHNCAKCHGKTAEGRFMAGPSLVSGKITDSSTEEIRDVITKGKHRKPKFEGKLSAADIDSLVDQIRAQAKQQ